VMMTGTVRILKHFRFGARNDVEHVGAARWAEIFVPLFEVAARVVFKFRMIPTQTELPNPVGSGPDVGNQDAGVVSAFSADGRLTGGGIGPSQLGTHGEFAANPARLQIRVVLFREAGISNILPRSGGRMNPSVFAWSLLVVVV